MALSAATEWDVRTTGLDTNGGGFVAGASGTDWSQQNAAQYAVTDAVTNGTTTITSATANFGTDVVGNILYIAGGTGAITAGWYEITVRNSTTSITVDRSTGLTTGTGATLNIGGSLLTIQRSITNMAGTADQVSWIKVGTYNLTTAINTSAPSAVLRRNRVYGYNVTHGDAPIGANRPVIATNGNAIEAVSADDSDWHFAHLIADGAGGSMGTTGFAVTASFSRLENCTARNFSDLGFYLGSVGGAVFRCEASGCGGAGFRIQASDCHVVRCWAHDNTSEGISIEAAGVSVIGNIASNNTGASSDGIFVSSSAHTLVVIGNTMVGNGRDGIRWDTALDFGSVVYNNILDSNAGFGLNTSGAGFPARASLSFDYNAFRNNTSGARNVILAGPHDVTLTADPFVNVAADNFALNTMSGGTACRATGYPGAFPGGLTTGYLDIGAVQHQDTPSTASAGITAQLV